MRKLKLPILILLLIAISACGSDDTQNRDFEPIDGMYEYAQSPITEPVGGATEAEAGEQEENAIIAAEIPQTDELFPEPDEPFPGRIMIVTGGIYVDEHGYRIGQTLVERYGEEKVIHLTWPLVFLGRRDLIIRFAQQAAEPDVGAVIFTFDHDSMWLVERIREKRGDCIFIVDISLERLFFRTIYFGEYTILMPPTQVNIFLGTHMPLIGNHFVEQAKLMGAETIIHYSFPRHMAIPFIAERHDDMAEAAERAGIAFIEVETPDPMIYSMSESQLFIEQDVPRQVELHGRNTVFFSTNCGQQIPLIQQVIATGALFVQPCCPSPFHVFPVALGLAADEWEASENFRLREIIDATSEIIYATGMRGRVSNWALHGFGHYSVGAPLNIAFMYAAEWLNDRAPRNSGKIDIDLLQRLVDEYIYEQFGRHMHMQLELLQIGDVTVPNAVVGLPPFIMY